MLRKVRCFAKVNLLLSVPRKFDDGYHEICSVMQSVSLFDRLTVKAADSITVVSDFAPAGGDNICYNAAKLFSDMGGAHIEIKKGIPLLSGLGGGSSDAAGTLMALNSIYGEPYSQSRLEEMALALGSDVPFFVRGGTQLVRGRGDELSRLRNFDGVFLIVMHGHKKSTGHMYGELDICGLSDRTYEVEAFCRNMDGRTVFNDFEKAFECETVKSDLLKNGALSACLSGSGPSVFGIFASEAEAVKAKKRLETKYDRVYFCTAVNSGAVFE